MGRVGEWQSALRMSSQVAEVVVGIEPGAMAVAEIETDRVVADLLPAEHLHALEAVGTFVPAVFHAKDVPLALHFGARRGGAELLKGEITLRAIAPGDGDLAANDLDVLWRDHGAIGWWVQ